jgi:hypothetical protein
VQTKLEKSPFSGHVFVFRGRRGDLIKVLWYDGDGLCLFSKRLERGRFVWPQATQRHGFSDASAVIDAAGRHRLATTGTNIGAAVVGVTHEILSTIFFARVLRRTPAFMRYSAHGSDRDATPTSDCAN